MRTRRHAALVVYTALAGTLLAGGSVDAIAQPRESLRRSLSGRWTLNRELSENAEAKLERLHSSPGSGHGPARHGGGGSGAGQSAQMEEVRRLLLNPASWFVVTGDGERIVLTDNDGRVRMLIANGLKEKVNGRDVRTKWDNERLVSESSLGNATVTETYERAASGQQLIVATTLDMGGQIVTVRRVYAMDHPR